MQNSVHVADSERVDAEHCSINVVLVESCTYRNKLGNDKRKEELLYDSRLCSHCQLSNSKATWL
jgi:hypothetical protein